MPIPIIRKIRIRGAIVWEVDARALAAECKPRGIRLRRRLSTRRGAEAWAREILDRINTEPLTRIKVCELCDRFLESRKAVVRPDTLRGYRTAIGKLTAFCDDAGITFTDEVTKGVVGDFTDHVRRGVSKRTASQYVAVLGVCFGWAADRGYIERNLFAGLARRSRKTTRRTLTDDEREKIVTEAPHRDLWILMLATGLRVIELCRLDAERVRLKSPMPHLQVRGKGDKERTVPLSEEAAAAAERLLEAGRGRVWTGDRRTLHRAWADDREALGLSSDITPHVFRHDTASWWVNVALLPLPDVQRLLGHADLATTAIYLHPDGRRVSEAIRERGKILDGTSMVPVARKPDGQTG